MLRIDELNFQNKNFLFNEYTFIKTWELWICGVDNEQ